MNGPHDRELFEADDEDFTDEQLPMVYNSRRHREKIEGSALETHSWRMKERVLVMRFFLFHNYLVDGSIVVDVAEYVFL